MPLVVPVLRLAYVFLNVFDTFKVLRLPPPSARNGGQPSARAMSQRKRAMKGIMTVWIVWVCFTLYERWVETLVWLFIPFYSEIKALVILFFLLTRAKGAEPIFLHLIRPLIKPYTVPLDALFEGLSSIGDLLVLVASIPVQYVQNFYRRWTSSLDPPDVDVRSWHADAPPAGGRPTAHRAYVSEANGDPRPAPAREISTGSMRQTRSATAASGASTPTHQIWRPSAAAYADEASLNPHSGLPTPPPNERQPPSSGVVDEWRQYPAFPSAYPPTPLPASSRLPSVEPSILAPRPVRPSQFTGIAEESDDEDNYNPETRQDFRQSLQLPREPRNPGSDGGLSDENHTKGVHHVQTPEQTDSRPRTASGDEEAYEMSVDEADSDMDYEDEDDFDVTLRTPHPRKHGAPESMLSDDDMLTPPPSAIAFTMSIDSQMSKSTTLSTTDNGSSLRTRADSLSSTALSSVHDTSSLAGRKRRLPRSEDNARFSIRVSPRKAKIASRIPSSRTSSRSTTIGRTRGKAVASAASSVDETGAVDDVPSDEPSVDSKRQKTTGGRVARPKANRNDSAGTIRGPPSRSTSRPASRPVSVASRQPSSRIAAGSKDRLKLATKSSAASTRSIARKTGGAPAGQVAKAE
ncbi:uncharacterized protein TRAVEDRAFT_63287 [Trametes versicolor FP-101664 SS1]|uniref:uncharacterized protein n=1 Tax=Trametes versicolor (strain FP-101664) TaxID=717944 RepID=UPI00046212BA|nr:uncharacterized protein TRAVEDRAFT_63287 [Trametes versicolor FP-101664 SS1]EIW61581.1 hypothetical protein TRAVEDRAFT_63287 [Trametes versicolor FP-101664 SS1]